jgi:OmpA-OmpF porin, OOP family
MVNAFNYALSTRVIVIMMISLLPATLYGVESDAKGCKDHSLMPRMEGYYIAECNEVPAMAELDIIRDDKTESVHFEGKSSVFSYMPQPDLKPVPCEDAVCGFIGDTVKKAGGAYFGKTYGQEWPVYTVTKDGKEYWVVLLITSGQYYNGSYACRIIEKADDQEKKAQAE